MTDEPDENQALRNACICTKIAADDIRAGRYGMASVAMHDAARFLKHMDAEQRCGEIPGRLSQNTEPKAFTGRDREVYEAHSAVECDGMASTRQIAEMLHLPVAQTARRLAGMARRRLVQKVGDHYWDDTADWCLTWHGCRAAEAAVPDHVKFVRWLDAEEASGAFCRRWERT